MLNCSAVVLIMPTISVDFWLPPCKQEINKLTYVTAAALKVFLTNFKIEQQSWFYYHLISKFHSEKEKHNSS